MQFSNDIHVSDIGCEKYESFFSCFTQTVHTCNLLRMCFNVTTSGCYIDTGYFDPESLLAWLYTRRIRLTTMNIVKTSPRGKACFGGGSSSFDVTVMKRLLKLELTLALFVVVFTFTGESITSSLSQNSAFSANIPASKVQ